MNIADEIIRLYSLNMGQADIAKHLNLDLETVKWVIKKWIPGRGNKIMSIIQDILKERERQDAEHGKDRNLLPSEWLLILGEEFGEVCTGIANWDIDNIREEAVQVAAVAIAMIECIDRNREDQNIKTRGPGLPPHICDNCGWEGDLKRDIREI